MIVATIILIGLMVFVVKQSLLQIYYDGFSSLSLMVDIIILYLLHLPTKYFIKKIKRGENESVSLKIDIKKPLMIVITIILVEFVYLLLKTTISFMFFEKTYNLFRIVIIIFDIVTLYLFYLLMKYFSKKIKK